MPCDGQRRDMGRSRWLKEAWVRACLFDKKEQLAVAYKLNTQTSARIVGSTDVQLAHLVLERRAFESEVLCGSTFAGYFSGRVF